MSDTRATSVYDDANSRIRHIAKTHAFQVWSANLPVGTDIDTAVTTYTTEAFTVSSTGNLGIGVTNPAYKFHVAGSSLLGNRLTGAESRWNASVNHVMGAGIGTLAGDTVYLQTFGVQAGGNFGFLQIYDRRSVNGNSWNNVGTRIQKRVDVTNQGYIEFNPIGSSAALAFSGGGSTEDVRILSSGFVGHDSPLVTGPVETTS